MEPHLDRPMERHMEPHAEPVVIVPGTLFPPLPRRSLARPTPVQPVAPARLVTGTALVVAACAAIVTIVALLPENRPATVASFVLGLLLVPLAAAPIEWFVHRFVYHEAVVPALRSIQVVHHAHHHSWFPTWRYTTEGPARRLPIGRRVRHEHRSGLRNAGVRLAHFTWYMTFGALIIWWPAWWATRDVAFMVGVLVASATVSNLFIVVHDTIHRPGSHRLVEGQPWFGFLDRHHYIHHVALGSNLNFLLPLGDLLFGTLRTHLTADELAAHGSLDAAKFRPVGQGERARPQMAG